MIARTQGGLLGRFVERVWVTDAGGTAGLERVVPTGRMHLVVRLDPRPLAIYADEADGEGERFRGSVVGGARARYHVRDGSTGGPSVGALLRPGAARALLGAPAREFSGRHVSLADVWGDAAARLEGRLVEAEGEAARLAIFEAELLGRLLEAHRVAVDPRLEAAAVRLAEGARVAEVAAALGQSPRRFFAWFEEAVGLAPKRYAAVVRASRALALAAKRPELSWTSIAERLGYSDLAHLHRELRALSGVTPREFRAIAPAHPNHLPLSPIRSSAARQPAERSTHDPDPRSLHLPPRA